MQVIARVDGNEIVDWISSTRVAELLVGGVRVDPSVGDGGFTERAQQSSKGFDFHAAQVRRDVEGEVGASEDGGEMADVVAVGDEGAHDPCSSLFGWLP